MIINSSNVGMESERSYASISKDAKSKTTYTLSGQSHFSNLLFSSYSEHEYNGDLIESKSDESYEENEETNSKIISIQEQMDAIHNRMRSITSAIKNDSWQYEDNLRTKLANECLNYLLRLLFGYEYEDWLSNSGFKPTNSEVNNAVNTASSNSLIIHLGTVQTDEHYFEEEETTSFSTKGIVTTADGREIDFNLDLTMSRSFAEYTGIKSESMLNLVDPLVINFNGNIADVSDQKFFFDIDADGIEDEISSLGKNSGFLALDKNNDGVINDGTELFGAKSGDGFSDLSEYDEDGNGWIDEADSIFDKLIIWTKDDNGADIQMSLKDAGIGALYTGKASTNFSLMSGHNTEEPLENALNNIGKVNSVIRSTGVFLYENGTAGTMQQIDMVKNVV